MTRTSGGLIHGYSGTIWTVAVLWSRDSYTRVYRGISLWIVHLAKRHVAHPASTNKRAASPTRLLFATIDCPRPRGCGAIGPTDSHNSIHYAGVPTQEQALRHWTSEWLALPQALSDFYLPRHSVALRSHATIYQIFFCVRHGPFGLGLCERHGDSIFFSAGRPIRV